jgi:hypothetical protein
MAKKPANAATTALKAVLPPGIKVIQVTRDAEVLVDVDVNDMVIPYTVAADGDVVIKSLVDRREPLVLTAGTHRVGWAFSHAAKGWMHRISIKVDGADTLLEKKSEANKDQDHSVGVVFLVVA